MRYIVMLPIAVSAFGTDNPLPVVAEFDVVGDIAPKEEPTAITPHISLNRQRLR